MLPRPTRFALPALSLATGLWANAAMAQDSQEPGFTTGLWTRGNLLGDAGGVRSGLWNLGITFGLQDVNEVWGNVSGGIRRGASYDGVTLMSVGLDTQRAFGWEGGTINVSAWNIRGRNIATDNLLSLQTPSGILAADTTRLWEVWYQQSFVDGRFDVKLGQQSIDQEFMTSQGSGLFLNTMMGWPMVPSADLYAGGPAYPLSSLGVRLRAQPGNGITALLGVFADNPPGGPFNDDGQLRGSTRWGGNFNLRTGALVVGEIQYALNQPGNGDMATGAGTGGLPGTYKLGFWCDSAPFPSQQLDNTGVPLANPASTGIALMQWNNFSLYAVADQIDLAPGGGQSPLDQRIRPRDGCAGRSQSDQPERQRRRYPEGTVPGPRRRHCGHRLRYRAGERRRAGVRSRHRILLRGCRAGQNHRDLYRGHLPVHRGALVAAPAGLSVCVQPRRRHRQSECPDPAHRQRGDLRPAQHHHILTA